MSVKPEVWNARTWEILDRRWMEGLSSSKIGLELGVSKNAVVSQARRRKLPSRPNPMTRKVSPSPASPTMRALSAPLPERVSPIRIMPRPPAPSTLGALVSEGGTDDGLIEEPAMEEEAETDWDYTEYHAARERDAERKRLALQCEYMVSEKPWVRCSATRVGGPGSPYCAEHRKGCFMGVT